MQHSVDESLLSDNLGASTLRDADPFYLDPDFALEQHERHAALAIQLKELLPINEMPDRHRAGSEHVVANNAFEDGQVG
jgi:hypothetical protein